MKFKRFVIGIIPYALAALSAYALVDALVNYRAHSDSGFGALMIAVVGIILTFLYAEHALAHKKYRTLAALALPAAVLVAVILIAYKIPNCPECDHTTAEDLGFLTKWIQPW